MEAPLMTKPPQFRLKVLSHRTVPAQAIRQHGPWTERPCSLGSRKIIANDQSPRSRNTPRGDDRLLRVRRTAERSNLVIEESRTQARRHAPRPTVEH
jgi:hypothetical protein